MNLWAVFGAGLLAGATTCAVTQGGLLVGLIARQKKAAVAAGLVPADHTESPTEDLIPVGGFLVGKLLILTLLGLLLGAVGSFLSLDSRIGGFAQFFAGVVMIVLALSMLGVPGFRDIVIAPPASWTNVVRKSTKSQSAFAPFLLGLATVLVPCGVTISMMLLAAASGSAVKGATIMMVFVLGTAPMFAVFGFVTQRYVSPNNRVLSNSLAAVVLVIGLVTINAGLVVLGSPLTAQKIADGVFHKNSAPAAPAPTLVNGVQTIRIAAKSDGYSPSTVNAKAGVPTTLVFTTKDTISCIVATVIPKLNKSVQLPMNGETKLDLGILTAGEIPYSCSMGMYTGTIIVSS
jgi:sulfite exporter TauE/SafE